MALSKMKVKSPTLMRGASTLSNKQLSIKSPLFAIGTPGSGEGETTTAALLSKPSLEDAISPRERLFAPQKPTLQSSFLERLQAQKKAFKKNTNSSKNTE